jgi:glucosamine-6-phosphate deaminase
MPIKVLITKDFEHMSQVAAQIVTSKLGELSRTQKETVLGLATGNSPTGMYKCLAQAANDVV